MARSARALLLLTLALLQSLCGVSPARSFVLCICVDGGIVLEAHDETCRCCAALDSCCEAAVPEPGTDVERCSCTRFAVQGEDASALRTTTQLTVGPAALEIVPAWSMPFLPLTREPRGPLDLDPDRHDPLRALRTVVLRY